MRQNTEIAGLFDMLPVGMSIELPVVPRLDVATSALGFYNINNIVLNDRWFPSFNGLCTNEPNNPIPVDDKECFTGYPMTNGNICFYLNELFPDSKYTINGTLISGAFSEIAQQGVRRGLIFLPTTGGPINRGITDGGAYRFFPDWMMNEIRNNTYHPYTFQNESVYDGETYTFYNLDWRDSETRDLYMYCAYQFVNYLNNTTINTNGKRYIDYIEYVKICFLGTWGEGTTLKLKASDYPSGTILINLSNYLCNLFLNEHVPCVVSLASALNAHFPKEYVDYILDNDENNNRGLFFDGADIPQSTMFQQIGHSSGIANDTVLDGHSGATLERMNEAFSICSRNMTYVECTNYIYKGVTPDFAALESYAKYFSPDFFSLENVFFDHPNRDIYKLNLNLKKTIKHISHYVGTRLYILAIDASFNDGSSFTVNLTIGNYGTAKVSRYWKIVFYLKRSDGTLSNAFDSGFDLNKIPKPFEPGVPNHRDAIQFQNGTQPHTVPTAFRTGSVDLLVAIEDSQGIYQKNLLFCNTKKSLPREYDTNNEFTGRFILKHWD